MTRARSFTVVGETVGGESRSYFCEVAFVRFLSGYVLWIDGEPFNEGEPYASHGAAVAAAKRELNAIDLSAGPGQICKILVASPGS